LWLLCHGSGPTAFLGNHGKEILHFIRLTSKGISSSSPATTAHDVYLQLHPTTNSASSFTLPFYRIIKTILFQTLHRICCSNHNMPAQTIKQRKAQMNGVSKTAMAAKATPPVPHAANGASPFEIMASRIANRVAEMAENVTFAERAV